ncbi:hypothetical protein [Streptomyces sp. NPDC056713]|uniref:hypothetical protein n=1 Tax=Streptomyces sp. NPDC056713 TaxID=3345921 RepID=UPI003687DD01
MATSEKAALASASTSWQLVLGREGLKVSAGRHLRVSMSLTLLGWLASLGGIVGTGSYWSFLG